jgi:hypothetical protein
MNEALLVLLGILFFIKGLKVSKALVVTFKYIATPDPKTLIFENDKSNFIEYVIEV